MTSRDSNETRRIGFIGLGVMGLPMANNLVAAGLDVLVYDAATAAVDRARLAGHQTASSLGEVVSSVDVLLSMLPDTPQVDDIVNADDGLLASARSDLIFVDMSSISPLGALRIHQSLAGAGIRMLDAPVSGGQPKAVTGQLSIMVGGAAETLAQVSAVLEVLGTPVLMGGPGAGQSTKACNQVAVALTIQAMCEAFALGSKLGLDLEHLRTALLGGSSASWLLENMGPQILAGDDSASFRVALQVKDLRIASEAAFATSAYLPGLSNVLGLYTEAIAHGQLDDGNQTLARVYERLTGAVIGARPYQSRASA